VEGDQAGGKAHWANTEDPGNLVAVQVPMRDGKDSAEAVHHQQTIQQLRMQEASEDKAESARRQKADVKGREKNRVQQKPRHQF